MRSDGYHATTPDPGARQLRLAIDQALVDAGLHRCDLGYVNAHGTGTRENDHCEALALSELFGSIPTASWKRTYSHTMGACAAIEAVGCCLARQQQSLFPSAGVERGTPMDGIEVVARCRPARLTSVLSTTLAFGGVNAALVFGQADRCA